MLFSGHDFERWLLKTMAAMGSSSNLSSEGVTLPASFDPAIDFGRLLRDPVAWPEGAGVYFSQRVGDRFISADEFQLAPLTRRLSREIVGLKVTLQGLAFDFFAVRPDRADVADPGGYRPASMTFRFGEARNVIEFSWEDGLLHRKAEIEMAIRLRNEVEAEQAVTRGIVAAARL